MTAKDMMFRVLVRVMAFLKKDVSESSQKMIYAATMRKTAKEMDKDQLGQLIRYFSHALDKAVRCEAGPSGRGMEKKRILSAALEEWQWRGYAEGPDKLWARDVLKQYDKWSAGGGKLIEPVPDDVDYPKIDSTDLFEIIEGRKSVRFWKKKPVERDKIEKMVRAATYAPSSCNRMTWRFFIIESGMDKVVEGDSTNKSMLEKAPVRIYLAIDERMYPEIYAPALDAGFALQNLVLAAHALGLGTCLMYHSESVNQAKLKSELNIPAHYMIYCAVMLGYPAEVPSTTARVAVNEVITYVDKPNNSAGADCFAD